MKTTIAIACQGGGAETAFTAGALHALVEAGIEKEFEIVSVGGTSGGVVCASLIWYALHRRRKAGMAAAGKVLDGDQSAAVDTGAHF
jgi:predicted acylesterase/phospholipase RssA